MQNKVQFITYVDRLTRGGFRQLKELVDGKFAGLFGGVHVLPFFNPIDGADAGFDPTDHTIVDPRLGDWEDVRALSGSVEIMADLIVNHVSSQSGAFTDFIAKGSASEFADMRVNRLATVQEHYMLIKALNSGVPEEKLAKTFDLDISMIKRRRTLLDGICPEVIELLKDKSVNPVTFDVLRKMRPMRQIESAELMLTVHNWTSSYAKALLAATKQEDLAKPDRPKKIGGLTREQMARMEREMASLHQDFKQIEESYGDDILHLVVASGYLSKLVGNSEIERFLTQRYPEFLDEFRAIIVASSLDQTGLAAN